MDFKDILCAKIFLQVNADEYSDEDSCRTAVLANSYWGIWQCEMSCVGQALSNWHCTEPWRILRKMNIFIGVDSQALPIGRPKSIGFTHDIVLKIWQSSRRVTGVQFPYSVPAWAACVAAQWQTEHSHQLLRMNIQTTQNTKRLLGKCTARVQNMTWVQRWKISGPASWYHPGLLQMAKWHAAV